MSMIIENTAYRLRVRSDNGRILTGQRTYLSQGVTKRGKKWYKEECTMLLKRQRKI